MSTFRLRKAHFFKDLLVLQIQYEHYHPFDACGHSHSDTRWRDARVEDLLDDEKPHFCPPGWRFRHGLFGRLVLQRKFVAWCDAQTHDAQEFSRQQAAYRRGYEQGVCVRNDIELKFRNVEEAIEEA